MLKLILYFIIIAAGTGTGYLMARPYENRILHLQDLISVLKILEAEMKYRRDPLPLLLKRIGKMSHNQAGEFFLRISEGLQSSYAFDFYGSWSWAVNEIYGESALTETDRSIISEAGIELGKTDMNNQHSLFARLFSRLEQQITEATEDKKTKGRMYQALGTAGGILAVIVLL